MAGFGFFAGGMAQGVGAGASIGRQAIVDSAYAKLQAKNQAMMEQYRQSQESHMVAQEGLQRQHNELLSQQNQESPITSLLARYPGAGDEAGPLVNAIRASKDSNFTPPIPHQLGLPPDAAPMEHGPTMSPASAIPGLMNSFMSRVGAIGGEEKQAALAKEQAQTTRLGEQTDLQRQQLESTTEMKKLLLENKLKLQDPNYKTQTARAAAEGRGVKFGADGVPLKPLSTKELDDLEKIRDARDIFMSLDQGIKAGKFPQPGYAQSKMNEFKEKAGSFIPNALLGDNKSLDDPRMTGYFKFIRGTALDALNAVGGVRAAGSPTELKATASIFANPENSPGGLGARISGTASKLSRSYDELLKAHGTNHKDIEEYRNLSPHLLTPEEIMGVSAAPTGTATLPGQAPMQLGAPPGLGAHPLEQAFPGAVRPLGFKPIYPGQ